MFAWPECIKRIWIKWILCPNSRETSGSAIFTERHFNIEPEIHELYINLLCKHKPEEVYDYVRVSEGYRVPETLEVDAL